MTNSLIKYYVLSGELRRIVLAKHPLDAASKALDSANGETIDKFFFVDERGFRGLCASSHCVADFRIFKTEGEDETYD